MTTGKRRAPQCQPSHGRPRSRGRLCAARRSTSTNCPRARTSTPRTASCGRARQHRADCGRPDRTAVVTGEPGVVLLARTRTRGGSQSDWSAPVRFRMGWAERAFRCGTGAPGRDAALVDGRRRERLSALVRRRLRRVGKVHRERSRTSPTCVSTTRFTTARVDGHLVARARRESRLRRADNPAGGDLRRVERSTHGRSVPTAPRRCAVGRPCRTAVSPTGSPQPHSSSRASSSRQRHELPAAHVYIATDKDCVNIVHVVVAVRPTRLARQARSISERE